MYCDYEITVSPSMALAFRSRFFFRAFADLDSFRTCGGWYLTGYISGKDAKYPTQRTWQTVPTRVSVREIG